jgi:hypothetical protein
LRNHKRESERAQAAYLIGSETVAKFSSFRQLRVSTINDFLAVTGVTFRRDGHQQASARSNDNWPAVRCDSHQRHDADCITPQIALQPVHLHDIVLRRSFPPYSVLRFYCCDLHRGRMLRFSSAPNRIGRASRLSCSPRMRSALTSTEVPFKN